MTTTVEAKNSLSVRLYRSQMEAQRIAREHAVSDKLLEVLQKATRHLEKNPLETLDVRIGSMDWKELPSESIDFEVAKQLSNDFSALTGEKPGEKSTTFIYQSTLPGLYIRQITHYPLSGKHRFTLALVGKATP